MADPETTADLRRSFAYGARSNLDFKFLKDLDDAEFGDFVEELLGAVGASTDDGDVGRVLDVAYRWQIRAYGAHLGDPAEFPHAHDDVPLASPDVPLSDARVALLTSSGHFVEGDDPRPFGVEDMTQAEAEARIGEFLRLAPTLSEIPVDTPADRIRVRHGGYPVAAVAADHRVALPLEHLTALAAEGTIGGVVSPALSFVGAASQIRIRKEAGPAWAQRLREMDADVVLLVPV